jgi:hypothetical protein
MSIIFNFIEVEHQIRIEIFLWILKYSLTAMCDWNAPTDTALVTMKVAWL